MLGLDLPQLIARIVVLVVAFSVHEFAHAFVADRFGDDTPRANGRLTLNPLAHLDPMGSLLLLVAGFGWAKPVPINPYALGRRSSMAVMWVSLAGPMSNFLMAIIGAIPLRFGLVPFTGISQTGLPSLFELLYYFIIINLTLMLFNLIPIAPLDGEKIAVAVLPEKWGQAVARFASYGPIVLMVVVFVLPLVRIDLLSWIISPVLNNLFSLLVGA
jgi:Zn-dependent protease